jgi:hypothetical protein
VQHNAQLAMIGVGLVGVQVRDLAHGEKSQQDKAHAHDNQRELLPGAALGAEMCPKSCQLGKPHHSHSTRECTYFDAESNRRLAGTGGFCNKACSQYQTPRGSGCHAELQWSRVLSRLFRDEPVSAQVFGTLPRNSVCAPFIAAFRDERVFTTLAPTSRPPRKIAQKHVKNSASKRFIETKTAFNCSFGKLNGALCSISQPARVSFTNYLEPGEVNA